MSSTNINVYVSVCEFYCFVLDGVYPHFDSRTRTFELDSCQDLGKMCLVFRNSKQGKATFFCKIKPFILKDNSTVSGL